MRVQPDSAKIETIFSVAGGSTASFGGGASSVVADLGILGGGKEEEAEGLLRFWRNTILGGWIWRISGVKVSFLTT